MPVQYRSLTPEQRQFFLDHGWIRIEGAVPMENIKRFTQDVWIRLGYDPNDKSTWAKEKVRMCGMSKQPTIFMVSRFICLATAKY